MASNNTRFYKYIQMHINTLKKQRKHTERDRWCSSMLCVYSTEYKISFTFILWFECENSEQHTDNMGVMIKFRKIKASYLGMPHKRAVNVYKSFVNTLVIRLF